MTAKEKILYEVAIAIIWMAIGAGLNSFVVLGPHEARMDNLSKLANYNYKQNLDDREHINLFYKSTRLAHWHGRGGAYNKNQRLFMQSLKKLAEEYEVNRN